MCQCYHNPPKWHYNLNPTVNNNRMSKPASTLMNSRTLNTFVRQNTPASNYYFTTENHSQILDKNPALRFKSGGWQEDNKTWGLLWTLQGSTKPMPKLDISVKQKLVRVTTKSGEKVMAVTYNTESCLKNC